MGHKHFLNTLVEPQGIYVIPLLLALTPGLLIVFVVQDLFKKQPAEQPPAVVSRWKSSSF